MADPINRGSIQVMEVHDHCGCANCPFGAHNEVTETSLCGVPELEERFDCGGSTRLEIIAITDEISAQEARKDGQERWVSTPKTHDPSWAREAYTQESKERTMPEEPSRTRLLDLIRGKIKQATPSKRDVVLTLADADQLVKILGEPYLIDQYCEDFQVQCCTECPRTSCGDNQSPLKALTHAVASMRQAQGEYFATRSHEALQRSKTLEATVDGMIRDLKDREKGQVQQRLFPDRTDG